jgi:integrase
MLDIERTGNKRGYAILITLLMSGIRVSELVALDRSDLDVRGCKGLIVLSRKGKGAHTTAERRSKKGNLKSILKNEQIKQ